MSVSSSRLTCATDEPNSVGSMSLSTRRTPSWRQPQRGQTSSPRRASAGSCSSSCSTPAARIAQPSAMIGTSKNCRPQSAAAIMHRLRITGVSAGSMNWWKLLSTPPASAVSDTNSRNGKVTRSRSLVRPYL